MTAEVPRGWRAYGILAGLFATTVLVLAVSQPWFERRHPVLGSLTYTPYLLSEDTTLDELAMPFEELQLIEVVLKREWGFAFMIAAATGALLAFIAAGSRPTERNGRRGALAGVILAAIGVVLTGLMWYAFASAADDPLTTTQLRIGFLIGVPASLAWLGLSIVVWRIGARSRGPATVAASS